MFRIGRKIEKAGLSEQPFVEAQAIRKLATEAPRNFYHATVVRDPVERSISAFFQKVGSLLGGNLNVETKQTRKRSATMPPRLLLIDHTCIGDGTATGELKASLFAGWPSGRLLQLYDVGKSKVGLNGNSSYAPLDPMLANGIEKIERKIAAFRPDVILYRPVPKTEALHRLAMQLIDKLNLPLVTWIMDDWPTAYARENPRAAAGLEADWRTLIEMSTARFCISEAMATAFEERYGADFIAVANGIDPIDWRPLSLRTEGPVRVRYAGSLADNMTMSTVRLIAKAVERLASKGIDIQFEIKTRELWREFAGPHFKGLSHTSMIAADLTAEEYRAWLSQSDINVIGYNFDELSRGYTRYSLANKLPECLASGGALLAVGPADVATMAVLEKFDCGLRVTSNSVDAVADALWDLVKSPARRSELAQAAREVAFRHFNIADARQKFTKTLSVASAGKGKKILNTPRHSRDAGAHVDETAVIARLLSNRRGRKHVMIDVGAHFGASASYFHKLGWTIHCFEPDPANRAKLRERYAGGDAVSIDPRAVSDKPKSGVAFFTSQESTGISGLSAFHGTHEETSRVDVTTIDEIMREKEIATIDFLKIDVEGFDFSVLKGVPWGIIRPDVIECEFEDAKTKPIGHTWRDVAQYLVEKGYVVYISEWHPIIRYGIPHDWRRVIPFTDKTDIPADAWGNLLAFKSDPGRDAVQSAFSALMRRRNGASASHGAARPSNNKTAASAKSAPGVRRPFYAAYAERLQSRSPRLFAVARLIKRALAAIWRRRLLAAPALLLLGFMFVAGLAQPELESRILLSGGAVLIGILLVLLYLISWTYHRIRSLAQETAALRIALSRNASEERAKNAQMELELQKERGNIARLVSRTDNILLQLDAQMRANAELEEVVAEIDDGLASLESDLDAAKHGEAHSKKRIKEL